jgi:predicted dienelactone hydrolase
MRIALLTSRLACLGIFALHLSITAAASPEVVVGISTIDVRDELRKRTLTTEIWYAAAPGVKAEGFSKVLPIAQIQVAPNAAVAQHVTAKPLVVISHGNWGTRYSQGWIAIQLVRAGYVVISTSHPGTMNDDRTLSGSIRLWDRSEDVRVALSAVLKSPQWAPLIDSERIGFWGHSFGGWTGVSLAGGRFDFNEQLAACKEQAPKDMYCTGLTTENLEAVSLQGAQDSYRDSRFKSFYLAATGPGRGMSRDSLQMIRTPMMFDTAKFDDVLAPPLHSSWLAAAIPSSKEIIRPVGHFTYVPICKPLLGKIVASLICTDPKEVDRADIHARVGRDTILFFNRTLGVAP